MRAEDTYKIEEIGKITTVRVTRTEWELSGDAKRLFYSIYNDWEMNVCMKHQHDPLLSGKTNITYVYKSTCFPKIKTNVGNESKLNKFQNILLADSLQTI
jgi:hypothetical protein